MALLLFISTLSLAACGLGLWRQRQERRALRAPLLRTGALAARAADDDRSALATEGRVLPSTTPCLAPASGVPCLAWELSIERLSETTRQTRDGTVTVKHRQTLRTLRGGAVVHLDDGSGAVLVDFTDGGQFDQMKDSYRKQLNGHAGSARLIFGNYVFEVPLLDHDGARTPGFVAVERTVPAEGTLFVVGQLQGGRVVKPAWKPLLASTRGREGLRRAMHRRRRLGLLGGGALAASALLLMAVTPDAPRSAPPPRHAPARDVPVSAAPEAGQPQRGVSARSSNERSW